MLYYITSNFKIKPIFITELNNSDHWSSPWVARRESPIEIEEIPVVVVERSRNEEDKIKTQWPILEPRRESALTRTRTLGRNPQRSHGSKKDNTKMVESSYSENDDDKDEHCSHRITMRSLQKPTVKKSFISFSNYGSLANAHSTNLFDLFFSRTRH